MSVYWAQGLGELEGDILPEHGYIPQPKSCLNPVMYWFYGGFIK